MIEKIKNGLKKRKVKVFIVFLFCSALIWFISKLSENYSNRAVIDLSYVNIPDDQMLIHASHDKINVKIEGLGFQFLRYSIYNKVVEIDLSTIKEEGNQFFIAKNDYKSQIEKQLNTAMKLLDIENDTLFFEFQEAVIKRVPVKPLMRLNLVHNYALDGALILEPDSITIKGPKNEVDSILDVKSAEVNLIKVTSDFSKKTKLIKSEQLLNTHFSAEFVTINGRVSKFSEKNIEVEIEALHLPENTSLKMFPDVVTILCKGSLEVLKALNASDFQVVVDYRNVKMGVSEKMSLVIRKQPENLQSAILQETEIEYILEHK